MKKICVMTWKTFLSLFKEDYSLFYFNGYDWFYKGTDIKIILHLFDNIIENNKVVFYNEGEYLWNNIK